MTPVVDEHDAASRDAAGGVTTPAAAGVVGRPTDDESLGSWLWRRLRRHWPLVAVAVAILVTAALTARPADTQLPLDPASTAHDGTRALVDVLRTLDAPVRTATPDTIGDADVVLVLADQLTDLQREDLRARARRGARVVVADPQSGLAPEVAGDVGLLDRALQPDCDVAALRGVREVRPGFAAVFLEVDDAATGCLPDDDGSAALLVVTPTGQGHVVALGDPSLVTNARLGVADHAPLVVQLLTPAGARDIAVVAPSLRAPEDGAERLGDLVPPWVVVAITQLLLAFVVVVMWRARRLGRPLPDRRPVRLPSSDLPAAVGALLARNRTRGAAATRIAEDARLRLARRVGLSARAEPDELAQAIARLTGRDAATVAAVLDPPTPTDDGALLASAVALAALDDDLQRTLSPPTEPRDAD